MKELRNSENLKKEILEDARKKAEKILKNSESQIKEIEDEWDKKTSEEIGSLKTEFERRVALLETETKVSVPLEKKRIRQKFLTEQFEKCLESFTASLTVKEVEELLAKRLINGLAFLGDGKLDVSFFGMSKEEAQTVLSKGIDSSRIGSLSPSKEKKRGLILEPSDHSFRFRLTLEEVTEELREYHRKEIYEALFKGKNHND